MRDLIKIPWGCNVCTDNLTNLMLASRFSNHGNNKELVKLILQNGANINDKNKYGKTALLYSIEYLNSDSDYETVKYLIKMEQT